MKTQIESAIAKLKEDHPEINEILEKFQISHETYMAAMASIAVKVPTKPTYALTVGGTYNVNVSASN